MAAKNTFYVHLFRYRIAAVVLRTVHCQFDSCAFSIRKSSMNNRFGGDILICFRVAITLRAAKFSGIWEDLSFPMYPKALLKARRKFLFKFSKSFAGRSYHPERQEHIFCGTPIAIFCKRLTKLFR